MKKNLISQLNLLKLKYEGLDFDQSLVYKEVCSLIVDEEKIAKIASDLSQIENGEKLFNIVGRLSNKLSEKRVDEIVLSAFAEYDTGRWLVTGFIEGKYEEITYIPNSNNIKSPDYYVKLNGKTKPVETKIVFPQNLDEYKCLRKIIDKINKDAIPQLTAFSSKLSFSESIVFIWTHEPISFQKISYSYLSNIFKREITKRDFELLILLTKYGSGLWDFKV